MGRCALVFPMELFVGRPEAPTTPAQRTRTRASEGGWVSGGRPLRGARILRCAESCRHPSPPSGLAGCLVTIRWGSRDLVKK